MSETKFYEVFKICEDKHIDSLIWQADNYL